MSISRRHFVMGTTALALAAPATVGRAKTDAIKFASILDLSGGLDIYGAPMAETTKMAIDDINTAGGLLGREVELTLYDAQSTIQFYTQYATQAAAGDRAHTVHAGITSASREAIRPTLARWPGMPIWRRNRGIPLGLWPRLRRWRRGIKTPICGPCPGSPWMRKPD